jgi:hypothetical protein
VATLNEDYAIEEVADGDESGPWRNRTTPPLRSWTSNCRGARGSTSPAPSGGPALAGTHVILLTA